MITDVGLDRFVLVSERAERAQVVAVAQQITLGRGIFLAGAITIFSPQLAAVFGAADNLKGVAWLGLVPLIASFRNWRTIQIQREYRYGPDAIASVSGQIAGLIAVIPAMAWLHDERVLVVSLVTEALVHVCLSHVLVKREHVSVVDPAIRKAAFIWGLPLMLNGLGLLALRQLDQVIVANLFGLKTLALYALGLNLAITPMSPMAAVAGKIGLPFLGGARGTPQASHRAVVVVLGMMCLAAAYALPVGLALDALVPLLYGRQYQVTEAFAALAMVVAFLRFCRNAPNMILLYHGMTGVLTIANLIAGVGLMCGLVLGLISRRIEGVMFGLVIGDLLSVFVLLAVLRRHLPTRTVLAHFFILATTITGAAATLWFGGNLTIGQRALLFLAGGTLICMEAAAIHRYITKSSKGWAGPSEPRIDQTIIPAP